MKKSGDISLKVNMDFGELLSVMAKSKPVKREEVKKPLKSASKKAAKNKS
jgi:hypothetical protein